MRFLVSLFFLFSVNFASAQVGPFDQSSADTQWKTIENDFVKVIYAEQFKNRAVYVANLIEHYSKVVGLTYRVPVPKKITLIIRDEMAIPNGFVTRGPRRTEWYNSSAYSPIVGSTEWLQTLSIHEYRHVIQQDSFNHATVKVFDFLMGDLGISLLEAFSKQSWMLEGDAVWMETKYTDAGRGRAPRFLARLKALLLAQDVPTYDQFISGTYRNRLVDQYVYGYILISKAYQQFGEDFWDKVNTRLTKNPTPWGLNSAFKRFAKMSFEQFYYQTFHELQKEFRKDAMPEVPATDYTVATNPKKIGADLYFVQYDLNKVPAVYKTSAGKTEKLLDIPFSDDLSRLDYFGKKAVYSEFTPHWRYGFKTYSDIVLVDLEKESLHTITSGERYYNPHFNLDGTKIIVTEFTRDSAWRIVEMDLDGKILRTLSIKDLNLVEAVALDADRLAVLAIDHSGYKSIVSLSFGSDTVTTLLPASRNNLFALQSNDKGEVLFEGQYKGATEIFKMNTQTQATVQCTKSKISSYSATFGTDAVYYSEQTPYGNRIAKFDPANCATIATGELVDFKYLGDNPSDKYNDFAPLSFPEQKEAYTAPAGKYSEQDYGSFDARGFTPHSWSFLGGRGFQLALVTDNYLRDFGSQILIGTSAEENTPMSAFQIDFKKFWPVLSLLGDYRDRSSQVMGTKDDLTWREYSYGVGITLPYSFKVHNYSGILGVVYQAQRLHTQDFELEEVEVAGNPSSDYVSQLVSLQFMFAKSAATRALVSPLSLTVIANYEDVSGINDNSLPGSYRAFGNMALTLPGFFTNNGIALRASGQKNREGTGNYLFPPPIIDATGYVYSRGFTYEPADEFGKVSANYLFPIAYPDINAGMYIYVNRIYMNLYFDHTKYTIADEGTNLNSYGAELAFQTKILRFLPLTMGLRYVHKLDPDIDETGFYLGTALTFF